MLLCVKFRHVYEDEQREKREERKNEWHKNNKERSAGIKKAAQTYRSSIWKIPSHSSTFLAVTLRALVRTHPHYAAWRDK
jgi:hypothetical protein